MRWEYALYLGRFQPPHQGHLASVRVALKFAERVCIGIRDTPLGPKDPLTVEERIRIWERLLEAEGLLGRTIIRKIPDFGKERVELPREDKVVLKGHPLLSWAREVERIFGVDPERAVFVGNKPPMVIAFNLLGYVVIPGHRNVHRLVEVSASELRRKILVGDDSWKRMLPEIVVEELERINIRERLLKLAGSGEEVSTG